MDLSDTIAPTSDQLDAVDLLAGERTFTISRVSKGDPEQPVNIHLAEFPRPWRPGKSMRRVLVACWGPDATAYVGRRVTLFCDPAVRFGGEEVGGTRIRALSHIDKPRTVPLLVTRGRSAPYRVQVLDEAPAVSAIDRLRAEWQTAGPERRKVIEAEVAALQQQSGRPAPAPAPAPEPVPAAVDDAVDDALADPVDDSPEPDEPDPVVDVPEPTDEELAAAYAAEQAGLAEQAGAEPKGWEA